MAETAGKPAGESASPAVPPNTWERLIEDWKRRPKTWLSYLAIAALTIVALLIGKHYLSSRISESQNERTAAMRKAAEEQDPDERAARYSDLLEKVDGTEVEPYVLWLSAVTRKDAGDKAEKPSEKLRHYEEAHSTANKLISEFPTSPWAAMPWRPALQPGVTTTPSPAARISEFCQKQIEWLKAHPAAVEETPDSGASAKLVLADPESKEHTLELKFFSQEAPYAVDAFFDLARQGVFDGTLVHGLERDDPNTDDTHAVHLGSVMSKLAPDKPDTWAGEKDYPGFTLPKEDSRLKAKKGRLAFDVRRESSQGTGANPMVVGLNPLDIVIYVADPKIPRPDRTVFAEVSGEPEALALLAQVPAKKDQKLSSYVGANVFAPEKPWKIVRIISEGQPANPPPVPLKRSLKLPDAPTPPEPPKDDVKPEAPKEEPKKEG
jgi:hypothetical protein